MNTEPHPFDPNTLPRWWEGEFRIYGDDNAETFCIVSCEDYQWAVQWRWHANRAPKRYKRIKGYFKRNLGAGGRYEPPLYLHVEIMKRTGIKPPAPDFHLVDHINGNVLDNRRSNLRWSTWSMNSRNTPATRKQKQMELA